MRKKSWMLISLIMFSACLSGCGDAAVQKAEAEVAGSEVAAVDAEDSVSLNDVDEDAAPETAAGTEEPEEEDADETGAAGQEGKDRAPEETMAEEQSEKTVSTGKHEKEQDQQPENVPETGQGEIPEETAVLSAGSINYADYICWTNGDIAFTEEGQAAADSTWTDGDWQAYYEWYDASIDAYKANNGAAAVPAGQDNEMTEQFAAAVAEECGNSPERAYDRAAYYTAVSGVSDANGTCTMDTTIKDAYDVAAQLKAEYPSFFEGVQKYGACVYWNGSYYQYVIARDY